MRNVSFQNNDNHGSFSEHALNYTDLASSKYYDEITETYSDPCQNPRMVSKIEPFASTILGIWQGSLIMHELLFWIHNQKKNNFEEEHVPPKVIDFNLLSTRQRHAHDIVVKNLNDDKQLLMKLVGQVGSCKSLLIGSSHQLLGNLINSRPKPS